MIPPPRPTFDDLDEPSRRRRAALSIAAAVLSGIRTLLWTHGEAKARDFDQVWYAASALLAGRNPYAEIGPGHRFSWPAPFYYPLTAPLSISPLTVFEPKTAAVLFAALASGAFVWAATRRSLAPAVVITSASAAFAAETVQWSPLLAAAYGLPLLGLFLCAKPTIGAAIFVARPNRAAIIGAALLVAVSLIVLPTWPVAWLAALRQTSLVTPGGTLYIAPITTPIGSIALLALLRWRRPEARLVFALACMPQTPLLYETVPLFLVPVSLGEGGVLWLGSWLVALWVQLAGPYPSDAERFIISARAISACLYVPAVVMLLRRQNYGEIPRWLEERLERSRLPKWLVGLSPTTR